MEHGHDFYLLGAGFSRAISARMPLLPDLCESVLPVLGIDPSALLPFAGNFEQWMSHLSVDQPWLSDSANFRNRALFLEASRAVHDAISQAETAAMRDEPSEWLLRLVMHWASSRDVVCSFNYDTLIERMLTSLGMVRAWSDLYAVSLDSRMPPGSSRFLSVDGPPGPVPEISKLHGSTSWSYGGPHAPTSDRITLTTDRLGWAGEARVPGPEDRYRPLYDDLEPLIVPPTTTKSGFYANLSLRAQWRRAYERLRHARSLTVIGYSFPAGDLQARHFVAQGVRRGIPVTVVDLHPDAGVEVATLLGRDSVATISGETAVADFVESSCGTVLRWGVVNDGGRILPVLDHAGLSQVPGDWAATSGRDESVDDHAGVQRWLITTLQSRWPERVHELRDPWPSHSGDGAGHDLRMAYVPRAER